MIGKLSSLYVGHVDLPSMGQMATPAAQSPSGSRGSSALDVEGELARRGIPMPEEIDVASPT